MSSFNINTIIDLQIISSVFTWLLRPDLGVLLQENAALCNTKVDSFQTPVT